MDNYNFEEDVSIFASEGHILLDEAEVSLFKIQTGKGFEEEVDAIMRSLHSLKGSATIIKHKEIENTVHHLEGLIVLKRPHGEFSKAFSNYLNSAINHFRFLVEFQDSQVEFSFEDPDSVDTIENKVLREERNRQLSQYKSLKLDQPTIMIVDHESQIRDSVEGLLEGSLIANIVGFSNSNDALEQMRNIRPDLIILDYEMPGMDGNEFIRKSNEAQTNIPIILASNFLDKDICLDALHSGAYAIAEKPFVQKDLLDIIEFQLERYYHFKNMVSGLNFLIARLGSLEKTITTDNQKRLMHDIHGCINMIWEYKSNIYKKESK